MENWWCPTMCTKSIYSIMLCTHILLNSDCNEINKCNGTKIYPTATGEAQNGLYFPNLIYYSVHIER